MGYFNGLINHAFKKTRDDKILFCNRGLFTSNYLISIEDEQKIKSFLNKYYRICLPTIIVATILVGFYSFLLLLLFIPYYKINIKRLLTNAEKTEKKAKYLERLNKMAKSMGYKTCKGLFWGSVVLTTGSIGMLFDPKVRTKGFFCFLFLGLCLLQIVYMLKHLKNQNKK